MGVKELWSVLAPICEKQSLWELENNMIAIDLSAWIVDSQSITSPQQNMYLRNLFFRTSYLLLLGVKPVFVLEGTAPIVKVAEIEKRIVARRPESCEVIVKGLRSKVATRRKLRGLQKQCVELLSYLGIECVQGRGEAEAYCAHLNAQGIVSGVVTQDSDVFLYGGTQVYRHFQMSPYYTVDCYRMSTIEEKLGLTRTKLIGFSVLTGCDYNAGVSKVGKATALKFLKSVPEEGLFQRFVDWKADANKVVNKKDLTSEQQLEQTIKMNALKDDNFPYVDAIEEFTAAPQESNFTYKWSRPNLNKFIDFAVKKLAWEQMYAAEKFLPLLARWHLLNPKIQCTLSITSIIAVGRARNASNYKVNWNQADMVTNEPKLLVAEAYPQLVAAFEESKNKKNAGKQSRKKKTKAIEHEKVPPDLPTEVLHLGPPPISKTQPSAVSDELIRLPQNLPKVTTTLNLNHTSADAAPAVTMSPKSNKSPVVQKRRGKGEARTKKKTKLKVTISPSPSPPESPPCRDVVIRTPSPSGQLIWTPSPPIHARLSSLKTPSPIQNIMWTPSPPENKGNHQEIKINPTCDHMASTSAVPTHPLSDQVTTSPQSPLNKRENCSERQKSSTLTPRQDFMVTSSPFIIENSQDKSSLETITVEMKPVDEIHDSCHTKQKMHLSESSDKGKVLNTTTFHSLLSTNIEKSCDMIRNSRSPSPLHNLDLTLTSNHSRNSPESETTINKVKLKTLPKKVISSSKITSNFSLVSESLNDALILPPSPEIPFRSESPQNSQSNNNATDSVSLFTLDDLNWTQSPQMNQSKRKNKRCSPSPTKKLNRSSPPTKSIKCNKTRTALPSYVAHQMSPSPPNSPVHDPPENEEFLSNNDTPVRNLLPKFNDQQNLSPVSDSTISEASTIHTDDIDFDISTIIDEIVSRRHTNPR